MSRLGHVAIALSIAGCGPDPAPLFGPFVGGAPDSDATAAGDTPDAAAACIGTMPCNSYSCCGVSFKVCASCVRGKWVWPVDDNCHFACGGPLGCAGPLPASFDSTCGKIAPKAGSTVCTDAMIESLLSCVGPTPDSTKCSAATKAAPDCTTCAFKTWTHLGRWDTAACIARIDSASACGSAVQCASDCVGTVCSGCEAYPGTGSKVDRSEFDDCKAATERRTDAGTGGACEAYATKSEPCSSGTFAPCFVRSVDDVRRFLRGACRDGGDWSKASDGVDGGTDAGDTIADDASSDSAAAVDGEVGAD